MRDTYDKAKTRFLKASTEAGVSASEDLGRIVGGILSEVMQSGDDALRKFSRQFDGTEIDEFRVSEEDIRSAVDALDPVTRQDTEFAIAQVEAFAQAQLGTMTPLEFENIPGVRLGHRVIPIERIGCYVPGGRYPILSAPVMSITPAKVAGCGHVIACLPPNASSDMIAVCKLSGADAVYRVGGAQAIAAMAFGTESVPAVDKVVGPGNAFVNEAKRQVFGRVGIDALAGPSEILTIADETGDATTIAADLLAQAEHDVHTRVGLATTSRTLAEQTLTEVERQLGTLLTAETAGKAWDVRGEVVLCEDDQSLIDFTNFVATEHLQVHHRNAEEIVPELVNYGSLFIGEGASVVYSDKCCGTNHTLPTEAAARYTGGLWVGTYVKVCTHQRMDPSGIAEVAPHAVRQSLTEGMEGHARAAAIRLFPEQKDAITSGDSPKV
jgi:histidinol dehydrogenase/sulfopropanediol 3-dehydrogenase